MKLYFWKDRHDGDMIQLGGKRSDGSLICWGQMHIDGVVSTFGESVRRELDRVLLMSVSNNHKEMPVFVESSVLVINGEPVSGVCHCGMPMDQHNESSGHCPVDMAS